MALRSYRLDGALELRPSALVTVPSFLSLYYSPELSGPYDKYSIVGWHRLDKIKNGSDFLGVWNATGGKMIVAYFRHGKYLFAVTDASYVNTTWPINAGETAYTVAGSFTSGSRVVTNVNFVDGTHAPSLPDIPAAYDFQVGERLNCADDSPFPHGSYVLSIDSATQFTMSSEATATSVATSFARQGGTSKLCHWVHLAFVYDGTQSTWQNRMRIYVNGVNQLLDYNSPIPANLTASTAPLTMGYNSAAAMSNLAIYPGVALTSAQVLDDSLFKRETSGLLCWWPCDDWSGSTLRDISGGHSGSISGDYNFSAYKPAEILGWVP